MSRLTSIGSGARFARAARLTSGAVLAARLTSGAVLFAGLATGAGAQSLADRVSRAPDGEVRLTYATRSGVCGDGRDAVGFGRSLNVYSSMESWGRWSGVQCVPGAARVTLGVRDHRVETVRTRVGGSWSTASGTVTDLGAVPAADAAAYFLTLAGRLDGRDTRNALLPAVIADSADVVPGLVRLGGDTAVARSTRRRAVHWLGQLGDRAIVPTLERFARGGDDADGDGSVGEAALFALSSLRDGSGVPSLVAFSRSAPTPRIQEKALFWLAQSDDAKAREAVRAAIVDRSLAERVRGQAIFALGVSGEATDADREWLRGLHGRLGSDQLEERLMQAVSQHDDPAGGRWLLAVAADTTAALRVRKQAVFWAGQGAAETRDIAALYDGPVGREIREHTIFVLSQRDDDASTTKLISVARTDRDPELRRKALFWLAQKHDPRVTSMIADILTHD